MSDWRINGKQIDGLRFTRLGDLNAYTAEEALAALAADDGEEETA